MYVTEAKLRSNLYLTDLPPGGCSQASALWAVRRRRKRGGGPVSKALCGAAATAERYCELRPEAKQCGSVVSKGVQGTAVTYATIANLTERTK